jgi:hypothetical protein
VTKFVIKLIDIMAAAPSPTASNTAVVISSVIVFVSVFGVYLATVYPSITGGDSGELVITACNLGTAHPPGIFQCSLFIEGKNERSFHRVEC